MSDATPRSIEMPQKLTAEESMLFASAWIDGQYENPWDRMPKPHPKKLIKWKREANPWKDEKRPLSPPAVFENALKRWASGIEAQTKVMWNGHATFMIETHDLRLMIDPVFGSASFAVPRRHESPLSVANTPKLQVILLTHGHYDHFESRVLKSMVKRFGQEVLFVVPEGLDAYLPRRANVITLKWWEGVTIRDVDVFFVPSQHWHRRGLNDYNQALWGGWYISGAHNIYHMGDSGYFGGFDMVRRVLGAPDLAFLPMGAYEPRWFMTYQHMAPDEALQAWDDVGAKHVVPMHWGTFDLSNEPLAHGPELFESLMHEQGRAEDLERWHRMLPGETIGLLGDEVVR